MCRVYTVDGIRLIGALAAAGDESGSQGADDPPEEAPTRTYSGRRARYAMMHRAGMTPARKRPDRAIDKEEPRLMPLG